MRKDFFTRYLEILGIVNKEPGMDLLEKVVKSQLLHLPFENISKIYYKKYRNLSGIPEPELFLNGVEKNHFGGTCYTLNYYLNLLLQYLGFEVRLCGADMSKPDVHIMNIVTLNDHEYIIDAGYAAPFLVPLPRDLKEDFVIEQGEKKYLVKPQDENHRTKVEMYEQNEFSHSYIAKPENRKIEEFKEPIDDSYREKSTFIHSLFLTKFYEDRTFLIFNLKSIEYSNKGTIVYNIKNRKELIALVNEKFRIPDYIIESVTGEYKQLNVELSLL